MFFTAFDKERKLFSGPKKEFILDTENVSLGKFVLDTLQKNGSKIAQICAETNHRIKYEELYSLTILVAKNLQKFGCQKDDRILYFTTNSAEIAPLVFASLCLGCPIVAFSPYLRTAEVNYQLSFLKPKYVICDIEYYPMLRECFMNMEISAQFFTFDGQMGGSIDIECLFDETDDNSPFVPTKVNGLTDVAFYLLSSGSTGQPKGIPLTHANVLDKMIRLSEIVESTDIMLGFTYINAVSAVRYLFGATLHGATRIVNPGSYSAELFFDLVKRFKVTFIASLPLSRIYLFLNHPQIELADLSSLRLFRCSGNKVPYNTILKLNKLLPNGKFCHSYGMTEMIGVIAMNMNHTKNDCVGQLLSGYEAKVINEQGQRLGIGEAGELCLKQPFMFDGFLAKSEEAEKQFDNDGFYVTGDIVRFDNNGDLFIIDRKKEMFKICGHHVIPGEIESLLNKMDCIMLSCVVPVPDIICDNMAAAVIVKNKQSTCTEESTEEYIYNTILKNFAHHKRLKGGIFFVDSIPTAVSGKIDRKSTAQLAIKLHSNKKKLRKSFSLNSFSA